MTAPLKSRRNPSSHSVASRSGWFVGSSRRSTSGDDSSRRATARRVFSPPDRREVGLPRSDSLQCSLPAAVPPDQSQLLPPLQPEAYILKDIVRSEGLGDIVDSQHAHGNLGYHVRAGGRRQAAGTATRGRMFVGARFE